MSPERCGTEREKGKGRNLFVLITENTTCAAAAARPPSLLEVETVSFLSFMLITFGKGLQVVQLALLYGLPYIANASIKLRGASVILSFLCKVR